MDKILVFTDIHIRGVGQTVLGIDALDRFREGVAHALRTHPTAKRIILMGDLAHSGRVTEYQRIKDVLDDLPIPLTLMCGNHDNRENLRAVFTDVEVTHSGHLQTVFDIGNAKIITLDTLAEPSETVPHHGGQLCADRMNWLANTLEDSKDRRVLVFMHHPPHVVGFPAMDGIRLSNGDAVLDLLQSHPNVVQFFSGHVHRTISGSVNRLAFSMFKSPSYQMPFDEIGASTAVSTAEPGAYGIIFLYENSVVVHTEDFQLAESDVQPNAESNPED